jgi:4-hydroxybenzoate polyprenyltransferase
MNVPAWMMERFPPDHWVMFFVMYATAVVTGRFLSGSGAMTLGWMDLLGFAAAWSFFLMLRVFDEHKDYELDLHNHPERVLQSGRVTLGHLKALGVLAIATQAGVSVFLDEGVGSVTTLWVLVIVWSSLMAKEFFIGAWLEKRLVLYALSHMVVMPMALVWMAQMGAGSAELPETIGLLAGLSFLSGAAFEVTRKAKGAEEERETIESYSRILGVRGAAVTVLLLLTGSTAVLALLIRGAFDGAAGWLWYLGLVAILVPPFFSLLRYMGTATAKTRKANEAAVGLAMLASYGILIAAYLVSSSSVTWG